VSKSLRWSNDIDTVPFLWCDKTRQYRLFSKYTHWVKTSHI